jgi:23S rRNA pseudouridine1911/1915/1917 synthase
MAIAKTLIAQTQLVKQLEQRTIKREYQAIVNGTIVAGGTISTDMGRHPTQRKKMAVVANGKPAVTHYRILEKFAYHTLVNVQLETGRTHQIRVHMAHIQHPVTGDSVYGGRLAIPGKLSAPLQQQLRDFKRQALHAWHLGLTHPESGQYFEWEAPLPEDMQQLLEGLKSN